ncbi:hypothetical protein T190_28365 [Sinorhizobium meliloti CCBAU 01290]|nr:hypothetical protein T190_28365 [Sinorhizobium meliloti CCBAU 01290]
MNRSASGSASAIARITDVSTAIIAANVFVVEIVMRGGRAGRDRAPAVGHQIRQDIDRRPGRLLAQFQIVVLKRLLDEPVDRLTRAARQSVRQIPGLAAADGQLRFGHLRFLDQIHRTIAISASDGKEITFRWLTIDTGYLSIVIVRGTRRPNGGSVA